MAELPIIFENIVTGQREKLSRRPQVEAYIRSGDLHKNAHVYDLGWRVDPAVRAEWESRFNDNNYIREFARRKKINPMDVTIHQVVDAWLDEVFEVDELAGRQTKSNIQDAQKDYLQRVAAASAKPAPAAKPKTTTK